MPNQHEHEQPSNDERYIAREIAAALEENRDISDAAARMIALRLNAGEGTPLHALATTGEIYPALTALYVVGLSDQDRPDDEIQQLAALGLYIVNRGEREPVEGWSKLWGEEPATPGPEPEQAERERSDTPPQVYIACLASYNDGQLHGMWVRADEGEDALWQAARTVLDTSPIPGAEEFAIFDHMGFMGVDVKDSTPLANVANLAERLYDHGQAFAFYVDLLGLDRLDEAVESFPDEYLGHWPDVTDYVRSELERLGIYKLLEKVPAQLVPYITIDVKGLASRWIDLMHVAHGDCGFYLYSTHDI